jgi:hypothetical protein
MGIGIRQPPISIRDTVVGTEQVSQADSSLQPEDGKHLKRHPKHPDLILQPQPSDDPNDPLNWSRLRKEASRVYMIESANRKVYLQPGNPVLLPVHHPLYCWDGSHRSSLRELLSDQLYQIQALIQRRSQGLLSWPPNSTGLSQTFRSSMVSSSCF